MPFRKYTEPPTSGPIRQGEILANVWELRPAHPTAEVEEGVSVRVDPIIHPRLVVLMQDCDLNSDFKARLEIQVTEQSDPGSDRDHPSTLPHILLCELYEQDEIKTRMPPGREMRKRISQNQDERYHMINSAPIGDGGLGALPDLYLDFKKVVSLPTAKLYEAITSSKITRVAIIPSIHLQDLIHRFFGFHSRVAVPEIDEEEVVYVAPMVSATGSASAPVSVFLDLFSLVKRQSRRLLEHFRRPKG